MLVTGSHSFLPTVRHRAEPLSLACGAEAKEARTVRVHVKVRSGWTMTEGLLLSSASSGILSPRDGGRGAGVSPRDGGWGCGVIDQAGKFLPVSILPSP